MFYVVAALIPLTQYASLVSTFDFQNVKNGMDLIFHQSNRLNLE